MMSRAEEETHRRVGDVMGWLRRRVKDFEGRIFSTMGDGVMAEFPSAVQALRCALRIQADAQQLNKTYPRDDWILFRVGISVGEIVVQRERTGGTTVNVAARLEALAEAGGICLTASVFEQVSRTVAATYEAAGRQTLKNIPGAVTLYQVPAAFCSAWIGPPALPRRALAQNDGAAGSGGDLRPSLAVLPFRVERGQVSGAYLAGGITDEVIRALSGLRDLMVVSRSAVLGFARAPLDVRRVGHELDVRYVLHGAVRRAGSTLRIAVELSDVPSGGVLWADRFEGGLDELFGLQDQIAMRVANAIAPQVRGMELGRGRRKPPDSMTAYDLTLQALDLFYQLDPEAVGQAHDLLVRAAELDPAYAPAHSHRARLLIRRIGQEWSADPAADRNSALQAARHAIELDPNDALALAIYGHLQAFLLRRLDLARDALDRALVAGPSCPQAWAYSSLTHGYLGKTAIAIEHGQAALRLSPIGEDASWFEHYLSQAYYLDGQMDPAIAWGRLSASHMPSNSSNLRCLIAALVAAGAIQDARTLAIELKRLAPGFGLIAFRQRTPLQGEPADLFVSRLREAGLPD